VVQIEVIPNYELEDKILGMGEHAKVLAPESLKAKIKARIAENLKNYE
jgi:predicted DNA-binding transcriptional regulator YafY